MRRTIGHQSIERADAARQTRRLPRQVGEGAGAARQAGRDGGLPRERVEGARAARLTRDQPSSVAE